jgi:alpha-L-fucosidase 2
MAIHPLGYIDPDFSDDDQTLADNCLEDLIFSGYGEWVGFSYTWASLIASRARRKWMPYRYIKDYIDGFVSSNSFNTNMDDKAKGYCYVPGKAMTLEAGFIGAAAILEMLIQSHNNLIRIFPTTPPSWGDIEFKDLRARGAFVVSAAMKNGEVDFVKIVSEAGKTCRIKYPFGNQPCYMNGSQVNYLDILSFETKPGETIILSRNKDYVDTGTSIDIARNKNVSSWFGSKKLPLF